MAFFACLFGFNARAVRYGKLITMKFPLSRLSLLLVAFVTAALSANAESGPSQSRAAWALERQILKRIVAPKFPKRDFVITRFGAVADGKTDCTEAITKAIAECAESGGGRVV